MIYHHQNPPSRSEIILIHILGYTSGSESGILKAVTCYRSCFKSFLHLGLSTYDMPVYRPYKNRFSFTMVGQNLTCCKNKGLILQILSNNADKAIGYITFKCYTCEICTCLLKYAYLPSKEVKSVSVFSQLEDTLMLPSDCLLSNTSALGLRAAPLRLGVT